MDYNTNTSIRGCTYRPVQCSLKIKFIWFSVFLATFHNSTCLEVSFFSFPIIALLCRLNYGKMYKFDTKQQNVQDYQHSWLIYYKTTTTKALEKDFFISQNSTILPLANSRPFHFPSFPSFRAYTFNRKNIYEIPRQ